MAKKIERACTTIDNYNLITMLMFKSVFSIFSEFVDICCDCVRAFHFCFTIVFIVVHWFPFKSFRTLFLILFNLN